MSLRPHWNSFRWSVSENLSEKINFIKQFYFITSTNKVLHAVVMYLTIIYSQFTTSPQLVLAVRVEYQAEKQKDKMVQMQITYRILNKNFIYISSLYVLPSSLNLDSNSGNMNKVTHIYMFTSIVYREHVLVDH